MSNRFSELKTTMHRRVVVFMCFSFLTSYLVGHGFFYYNPIYNSKTSSSQNIVDSLRPRKHAQVASWLEEGSSGLKENYGLDAVLEALQRPDGLSFLLDAATAVAASTKPLEERDKMWASMGHIGQVEEEISAYKVASRLPGIHHICEIGFNAGHSALTLLHMNPNDPRYTAFDISQTWGRRSKEFVDFLYPGRIDYIEGHSTETLAAYSLNLTKGNGGATQCDLFSVDGDHGFEQTVIDFRGARDITSQNGYILADDCTSSFQGVIEAWELAKTEGWIREIHCTGIVKVVDSWNKGWCFGNFQNP